MREVTVEVKFKEGMHARPAVKLVKLASGQESKITLIKNKENIPADSITAILGACIVFGDVITILAEGPDEEKAIKLMEDYFA